MASESEGKPGSAPSGHVIRAYHDQTSKKSTEEKSFFTKYLCLTVEERAICNLSFNHFLSMTAFAPIETLQSSLNPHAGLGPLSLACLYGSYFILAMWAPAVVRIITPKWCIVTGWICIALYITANFHPTWLTLVPAAILMGAMSGIRLTAKDLYVTHLAHRSVNSGTANFKEKYQSVLSFYNGIVFAGISLPQVVGQLISSAVLVQTSSPNSVSVCGAFGCHDGEFVSINITNQTNADPSRPSKSLVFILLGVLLSLTLTSILVVIVFLQPIPSGNQNHPLKATFLSCARRVSDPKMMLMIPQVVMYGFYQGMLTADYTKSYITCGAGVGMVGYVMMCFGVTSTLASVLCGRLVKYTGRHIQVIFALIGYIGLTVMLWVWIPSGNDTALFFIVPAVLGFTDVVFQTHICTILALMFKDDSASAFANWYTFRGLSKAVSFALSGMVCVWVKLSIASAILSLACVTFVVLELILKFQNHSSKDTVAL